MLANGAIRHRFGLDRAGNLRCGDARHSSAQRDMIMRNTSTGFGLFVLGLGIAAWPVLDRLMPSATASTIGAASSVVIAATAQAAPTVVWYQAVGDRFGASLFRAWSDGRVEVRAGAWVRYIKYDPQAGTTYCYRWQNGYFSYNETVCDGQDWSVVSDPSQGLTYRSDINFDERVDGADLASVLADWGSAQRQDIQPSECPLNLVNP
jgi:hypothetical protein